jgi:hypothetical protein
MVEFLEGLFADPRELVGKQGLIQLVLLIAAYGYGLARASKNISRGTELLLSIPEYSGLIGSVVLPVLGAVPDGAFILFSGLGPHAQDELSVGVGALAGSTVLLLTGGWGCCFTLFVREIAHVFVLPFSVDIVLSASNVGTVHHLWSCGPEQGRTREL